MLSSFHVERKFPLSTHYTSGWFGHRNHSTWLFFLQAKEDTSKSQIAGCRVEELRRVSGGCQGKTGSRHSLGTQAREAGDTRVQCAALWAGRDLQVVEGSCNSGPSLQGAPCTMYLEMGAGEVLQSGFPGPAQGHREMTAMGPYWKCYRTNMKSHELEVGEPVSVTNYPSDWPWASHLIPLALISKWERLTGDLQGPLQL